MQGAMAAMAVSISRGVHPSGNDWKNQFRVWDGRGRQVELDCGRRWRTRRGAAGTAASTSRSPSPWTAREEFYKGRVRRGAAAGASADFKPDAPLGDCPINFRRGKMLSEVSSWGIGGPAKMFVEVTTPSEMASVLRFVVSPSLFCLS